MVRADRSQRSTRRRGAGLAGGLVLMACCGGCQEPGTHVLLGQLYETGRDCLDPTTSIDIVDGPDPGSACDPTCVVTPIGQSGGGAGVYVTTMCGPYPPLDDTSGSPAACAGALAALARSDVCAASGGSSSPADASSPGEGGLDGGASSPEDAASLGDGGAGDASRE